ncbi:helix-turn-helix domain-containing protein [Chryseobacterium sp. JUb7]|uniref:helix-turn-helix domain-containing protein n=1 Tax=Chryseobacterium sp. JUb7 TaxID=2940599 RepID=UPI0021690908|nr:helix-turn-helix domain-containing protein [Chryseobacterium sp. JUb7]MCS3532928.1 transcriptional regulator with XRE-family HTH domain [Chryseobacterium sp. JUb7]
MSFFGTNIKKIRQVRGLSQKAFADLFELNRGVISSYEEGRAEPKIETLLKVADYFNLDLHDLLTETLQVNQLASGSDIDHLIFSTDHHVSTVSSMDPNAVVLQKILANIDLVYEFTKSNSLLSKYNYGDILFLNKADIKNDPFSTLLANIDGNLKYYSEINEEEKNNSELYKIVGYISSEQKNILSDILERIDILERK